MCEGATDMNQVGSLNRHYRDLYDYPAKILCSATFQNFKNHFKFLNGLSFVTYYRLCNKTNEKARISFLKRNEEFYQKHRHAEGKSVYFAGGAESVIYKCSTDDELSSQQGFILLAYFFVNGCTKFYNLYLNLYLPRTEIPIFLALALWLYLVKLRGEPSVFKVKIKPSKVKYPKWNYSQNLSWFERRWSNIGWLQLDRNGIDGSTIDRTRRSLCCVRMGFND